MVETATVRVMSPEQIAAMAGGETPFLVWPERDTLFASRSMRLRQLSRGHAMGDFLAFVAELAQAQQTALMRFPAVALPDAEVVDRAARLGVAPLPAAEWARDPAWQDALRALMADLRARAPAGALPAIDRVASASPDWLEAQADCLLTGVMHGLDLACASLVGAGLQVYWTHLVLETQKRFCSGGNPFGRIDDATACPCCASRPTASITRPAGDAPGQRYLHCALCATQWHMVRIQCTRCLSAKHVAYQALEAGDADGSRAASAAIQAETCDDCGHYLKIMHVDRDPFVEPVADDLASIALDLLVSDTGKLRHGVNLMLLFGDPDAAPAPDPGGGG